MRKTCGTQDSKKPVLLKVRSHSRCLEIKLGTLGVELWDYPNDEAKPYARLLFDLINKLQEEECHLQVDLDVMQAGTISVAIEQWLLSFESETKDANVPSIHMQIASLSIDLHTQVNGQGAKGEFVVRSEQGVEGRAVLTRLEASLLGTLLESLVDGEEADCRDCVG